MNTIQVVSIVTAIVGAMLGSAGFALSILAFRRDRPKLVVTLQWDMALVGNPETKIGLVRVTNTGRRPAYLAIVALQLPKGFKYDHLALMDSIPGKKLEEGGAPAVYQVTYAGMEVYKRVWNKIRAMAEDSSGKKYHSKYPKRKPSWAN
jgi:hypothetical protein